MAKLGMIAWRSLARYREPLREEKLALVQCHFTKKDQISECDKKSDWG
jgi:hypothetical protein